MVKKKTAKKGGSRAGRPPKGPDEPLYTFPVRINVEEELFRKLEEESARIGLSISALSRAILSHYFKQATEGKFRIILAGMDK